MSEERPLDEFVRKLMEMSVFKKAVASNPAQTEISPREAKMAEMQHERDKHQWQMEELELRQKYSVEKVRNHLNLIKSLIDQTLSMLE